MTVIAFFEDIGLALSDVMTSIDLSALGGMQINNLPNAVRLPTVGESVIEALPIRPTSIKRKIMKIKVGEKTGDFLVSGTVSHVKELSQNVRLIPTGLLALSTDQLRRLNLDSVASIVSVASEFTELHGKKDFEILGVCEGIRFNRQYDERIFDNFPYFGNVTFSGSGGEILRQWLADRGTQLARMDIGAEPLPHKRHRVKHWLPSMLLEEDSRNGYRTLTRGVGGYYEVFSFSKSGLSPLDDVLTVFASVEGRASNANVILDRLFYHRYTDDWMSVISYKGAGHEVDRSGFVRIPIEDFELFNIGPLLGEGAEPNRTSSYLVTAMNGADSYRLCLFRDKDKGGAYQVRRSYSSEHKILSSRVVDGYVHINFDRRLFEYYVKNFPKNVPSNEPRLFSQ